MGATVCGTGWSSLFFTFVRHTPSSSHQKSRSIYRVLYEALPPRLHARPLAAAKHRGLPAHIREDLVQLGCVPGDVALTGGWEFQQLFCTKMPQRRAVQRQLVAPTSGQPMLQSTHQYAMSVCAHSELGLPLSSPRGEGVATYPELSVATLQISLSRLVAAAASNPQPSCGCCLREMRVRTFD